jgi:hypothetical protein
MRLIRDVFPIRDWCAHFGFFGALTPTGGGTRHGDTSPDSIPGPVSNPGGGVPSGPAPIPVIYPYPPDPVGVTVWPRSIWLIAARRRLFSVSAASLDDLNIASNTFSIRAILSV